MSDPYLKSGIFLAPFHNHDENPTLSMERDLELLEHLDRLNYHEAWIGEHHSGGFELIACPEMFIAAAAQRTRHIRLGTGVVSLPYHNPFMLADRMVQLDHMTRGRAMFGVGPGALVHDALKIGIDPGDQRQMMNEAFEVIYDLLHGKTVNQKTDWFNLTDAQLQLRPYTRPTMELAVAAARSPSGSLLSGKYGVGMLSIGGTSPMAMEAHTRNWGLYEEPARANGHVPDRKNWRIVGLFHIAETREQARKNAEFGVQAFANYFRDVATFPIIPPEVPNPVDWLIESGTGCIGTPDDAIAYIERLMAGLGRVWGDLRIGAELGRLGGDQAALRVDGAFCAPAFPDQPRPAAGKLRLRHQPSRRLYRQGGGGDPERGRPARREPRRRSEAAGGGVGAGPRPIVVAAVHARVSQGEAGRCRARTGFSTTSRGSPPAPPAPSPGFAARSRPGRATSSNGCWPAWTWSAARSSRRRGRWPPRRATSRKSCCAGSRSWKRGSRSSKVRRPASKPASTS